MTRFRDLLIFALCILLALAPVVSANSGPTYYEGAAGSGMLVTGEDCPVVVEEETLTFYISQLPGKGLWSEGDFAAYTDHVIAQYTFRNPTDLDLTVGLLFPFGVTPVYVPDGMMELEKYAVIADGQPVQTKLRHSLSWGDFDMGEDSSKLSDTFMEHYFYAPEMPVTKYVFKPSGVEWGEHDTVRAKVRLDSDPAHTKYILAPANSFSTEDGYALAGSGLRERYTADLYIIGQIPESPLSWSLFREGEPIEGNMELVSTEQTTLREYLLSVRPENSGISDVDWYNAAVQMMVRSECAYGYLDVGFGMELMGWYEYELTIPAGETLVNTVTAPLYPDIHAGWEPAIYTYEYLLSPAEGWADFGTLTIHVKTPYHMTQCNLEGFGKNQEGYTLELDGLPDKELTFVLSTDAKPSPPGASAGGMLWFVGILGVVVLAGAILLRRK